jgi:hypothetical protein
VEIKSGDVRRSISEALDVECVSEYAQRIFHIAALRDEITLKFEQADFITISDVNAAGFRVMKNRLFSAEGITKHRE